MKKHFGKFSAASVGLALGFVVIGAAFGAAGIYVGETDDAPGAAMIGLALMVTAIVFAVRTVWRGRRVGTEERKR